MMKRVKRTNNTSEYYMQQALKQAKQAFDAYEVPIGAIIID